MIIIEILLRLHQLVGDCLQMIVGLSDGLGGHHNHDRHHCDQWFHHFYEDLRVFKILSMNSIQNRLIV